MDTFQLSIFNVSNYVMMLLYKDTLFKSLGMKSEVDDSILSNTDAKNVCSQPATPHSSSWCCTSQSTRATLPSFYQKGVTSYITNSWKTQLF